MNWINKLLNPFAKKKTFKVENLDDFLNASETEASLIELTDIILEKVALAMDWNA